MVVFQSTGGLKINGYNIFITGKDVKKGKTQEKMGRVSRKRSSSAGSEKMERVGGR